MANLIVASAAFLLIHLLVSGTKLRDAVTGTIGETAYLPLFALSSLGAVVWMCFGYSQAMAGAANTVLFDFGQGVRNAGVVVMALAFALFVPGVLRGNPTSAGQEKSEIRGVLRITRHPFLVSAMLWSAFHVAATGTAADTIFFGTFFVVAAVGTKAIDGKVSRKRPADWQLVSSQTSILPFAAIVAGRNRFVAREYFDWRFAVAVLLFAGFLWSHNWLFGVAAFPTAWLTF